MIKWAENPKKVWLKFTRTQNSYWSRSKDSCIVSFQKYSILCSTKSHLLSVIMFLLTCVITFTCVTYNAASLHTSVRVWILWHLLNLICCHINLCHLQKLTAWFSCLVSILLPWFTIREPLNLRKTEKLILEFSSF